MVEKLEFPHCEKLFSQIQQRFVLVEQVAAYKYQHQLPVYVPRVETKIISELKAAALAQQLDEQSVKPLIVFLMNISVQRQEALIKTWTQSNITKHTADNLENSLRPQIKTLTLDILKQIKQASGELKVEHRTALEKVMTKNIHPDNMSDSNKAQLLNLLLNIKESI